MERFILTLTDPSKRSFFLELITQLNFVEIQLEEELEEEKAEALEEYDFFQSVGLFADRNIDADQLRKEAWRISSK